MRCQVCGEPVARRHLSLPHAQPAHTEDDGDRGGCRLG